MIRGGKGLRLPDSRRGPPAWIRPATVATIVVAAVLGAFYVYGLFSEADGCAEVYCDAGLEVSAPAGFTRESAVYRFNEEFASSFEGEDVTLTMPLTTPASPNSELAFYEFDEASGTWSGLGDVLIKDGGESVAGVLPFAPRLVAVLRRTAATGQVIAYFDPSFAGATLHPTASERATIIHTLDYTPNDDGTLSGSPTHLSISGPAQLRPVISANAGIEGSIIAVEAILRTSASTSAHVEQIVEQVVTRDLSGIDIAYADLDPNMRSSFTLFIKDLASQLHERGKALTLTLPPPVLGPLRVDEEAYDWAQLGASADLIKIAPLRDQSTYRLSMPSILAYLSELVEPAKLVLMVTPYAAEKSSEGVRWLALADAMGIATDLRWRLDSGDVPVVDEPVEIVGVNIERDENLTGIVWDSNTATVAFSYKLGGTNRTVWIENDFSLPFKLELINLYGLGGVAVEDSRDDPFLGDIWRPLLPFIESGEPVFVQPNADDLVPRWADESGPLTGGERGVLTWVPRNEGINKVYLTLSEGTALFRNEFSMLIQNPVEAQ